MKMYSEMARNSQLLNKETEVRLTKEYRYGPSENRERIRDRLLESNIRLIINISSKFRNRGVEEDDLVQEGCRGFLRALDDFDPSKDLRLSTYATFWIRQFVSRYVRSKARAVAVPDHVMNDAVAVRSFARKFEQSVGRDPTAAEISAGTGIGISVVKRTLCALTPVMSMNAAVGEDEGTEAGDLIADERVKGPGESVSVGDFEDRINVVSEGLTEREKFILSLRYGTTYSGKYVNTLIGGRKQNAKTDRMTV